MTLIQNFGLILVSAHSILGLLYYKFLDDVMILVQQLICRTGDTRGGKCHVSLEFKYGPIASVSTQLPKCLKLIWWILRSEQALLQSKSPQSYHQCIHLYLLQHHLTHHPPHLHLISHHHTKTVEVSLANFSVLAGKLIKTSICFEIDNFNGNYTFQARSSQ